MSFILIDALIDYSLVNKVFLMVLIVNLGNAKSFRITGRYTYIRGEAAYTVKGRYTQKAGRYTASTARIHGEATSCGEHTFWGSSFFFSLADVSREGKTQRNEQESDVTAFSSCIAGPARPFRSPLYARPRYEQHVWRCGAAVVVRIYTIRTRGNVYGSDAKRGTSAHTAGNYTEVGPRRII